MLNVVCKFHLLKSLQKLKGIRLALINTGMCNLTSWADRPRHLLKFNVCLQNQCYSYKNIRWFTDSSFFFRKCARSDDFKLHNLEESTDEWDDSHDDILESEFEPNIFERFFRIPGSGHNVFVIQPKMKMLSKRNFNTTPELQLAEAVTLAETLPGWKVVEKLIMSCQNPAKKHVFNTGNFETLKRRIQSNENVSAVFFGINILTGLQHAELEKELGLPVYDRYSLVLQIFLDHAHTSEAKLQVALAEIPYLRSRLRHFHDTSQNRTGGDMQYIGGSGESYIQKRRRILFEREVKLKKYVEKLRKRRCLLRQARSKSDLPVVAVVGYTNAGKTSLIKILTNDEKMEPKDQLFATLDVTAHATSSVGFQKIIYMDTVGFISDIPTALIESFSATLEDIALADLIIHIRDLNHPDAVSQKETVMETLKSLTLPQKLMDTIVEVGNKIDLLETIPETNDVVLVSSTKGTGIVELRKVVEEKLLENTGQLSTTLRVPTGGEASSWLYKVAGLKKVQPDPDDCNFSLMNVILSPGILAKFKHHFGDLEVHVYNNKDSL